MKLRRLIAAATALIITLTAVTACNGGDGKPEDTTDAQATAGEVDALAVPEDLNTVVASVKTDNEPDFFNITFADFYNEYLFYLNRQELDETSSTDAPTCAGYRSDIISYQMLERVILRIAEEYGVGKSSLTEAELNDIDASVKESYQSWCDSYKEDAIAVLGDTYTDEELYNKEFEFFTEFMARCNMTPDMFVTWQTNSVIQNKLYDYIISDLGVTEDEVNAFVEERINEAKDAWENNLATFESSYTAFFVPENTRVVEQIYFSFDTDTINEISAYRKDGDDTSADALVKDATAEVQAEVDAAVKALSEGTDWKTVQTSYNDDTNGNDQTYVVYPKSTVVSKLIIDAVGNIAEVGEYCDPVYTDFGVYIFKYTEAAEITDEDMKDLVDQATDYLLEGKQSKVVAEKVQEWQAKYPYDVDYDLIAVTTPAETTPAATEATTPAETTAPVEETTIA